MQEYVFTQDWFTRHEKLWSGVLKKYNGAPNIKYLEIGVFEGRSLLWMIENILTDETSTAYAVDPYEKVCPDFLENKKTFLKNLEKSNKEHRIRVINDFSEEALKKIEKNFFDIAYIDGNHDAEFVKKDLELAWPLMKLHSILIIDDYEYVPASDDNIVAPKREIDIFLQTHASEIEIINVAYQIILKKVCKKNDKLRAVHRFFAKLSKIFTTLG